MYYLRTKPAANALQFTVDKSKLKDAANSTLNGDHTPVKSHDLSDYDSPQRRERLEKLRLKQLEEERERELDAALVCSRENGDECMACGS